MIHYVCGFMFDYECSQVALIRKNKSDWQKDKLNGIGGKIEKDETPEDAIIREFKEETGYETEKDQWTHVLQLVVCKPEYCSVDFYTTCGDITTLKSITDEKIEIWNLSDMYYMSIIPNLLWIIPLCLDESIKFPLYLREKEVI